MKFSVHDGAAYLPQKAPGYSGLESKAPPVVLLRTTYHRTRKQVQPEHMETLRKAVFVRLVYRANIHTVLAGNELS